MNHVPTGARKIISVLALASAGAILTGCDDPVDIVPVKPEMVVDPVEIDFGSVQIGTVAERTIYIRNPGSGALSLQSITRGDGSDEAFAFEQEYRRLVAPNGLATVQVYFGPNELGEASASLVVRSADQGIEPVTIQIRGSGVNATLAVDPSNVNFGNVVVQTTKTIAVTLTNNSDVNGTVSYLPGQNVRQCSQSNVDNSTYCIRLPDRTIGPDGKFQLAAGESTRMEIQFSPQIVGTTERGNFTLSACQNNPSCDTTVRLTGIGIEQGFRCNPSSLDFGRVNPGSCVTRAASCQNIANDQVTVIGWGPAQAGGNATHASFSIEPGRVQVLNEGDTVSVDITYCPTDIGNHTGTLDIETDNRDVRLRHVYVPLAGSGGGPDIEVAPARLNFGLVSLIAPSRRSLLIANVGYDALEVTGIEPDLDGTGAFSLAQGDTAVSIPPGGSHVVVVEFQPVAEGPVTSHVLIRSNDTDEPEVRIPVTGEGVNLPPCNFEVQPATLSFGVVERGRLLRRAFTIANRGTDDCLVTSARLEGGTDAAFSLPDGDVMSLIIPGGSATTVAVEFAPTQSRAYSGSVEFSISNPTTPFVSVPLTGTGADATLLIVPPELNFGTIGINCAARARPVTLYNTGSTPARIDAIQIATPNSGAFHLASIPTLPATIAPGSSIVFEVGFRTDRAASYAGAVELSGNVGGQAVTYIVSLEGRGDADARQVDEFDQLGRPRVDILFVVDDSCSMFEEQTALSQNFGAFIQFADAQGLDYQIGVTTTDVRPNFAAGRLVSGSPASHNGPAANRIVTPNTLPSPAAVFLQNVTLGTSGDATERGLEAAYLALSNPLIFGHNAGFLRPDAVLAVVVVSDEEDYSSRTTDFYANFFLSIKGFRNTNLFSFSGIVGDAPSGCNGPGGNADPGLRYIDVAQRTGGVIQSICTADWARSLEDLANAAFGFKSRFFLSNQPIPATLEVYVDGVRIPGTGAQGAVNWIFDFSSNSVNFGPFSIPEPGAHIRVEYTAECL